MHTERGFEDLDHRLMELALSRFRTVSVAPPPNSDADLRYAIQLGVKLIQTDAPRRLMEIRAELEGASRQ